MSLCKNDLVIFNRDEMNILNVIMSIMSYLSIQANKNKRPLIILGPSGVGKDTIIKYKIIIN